MAQLQLPYEEIKDVASRDKLRQFFSVSSRVAYKIPVAVIKIREGFNKRRLYTEIEELADSILKTGLHTPLTVDVLPDGGVFLEKGHRRLRAIKMLIDRGETGFDQVDCYVNGKNVTELDRIANIIHSNEHAKGLTPLEQSAVAKDMKLFFDLSHQEIADRIGVSRQKVDYLLLVADAPDDMKEQIALGSMGLSKAVDFLRSQKRAEQQADKKEEGAARFTTPEAPLDKKLREEKREYQQEEETLTGQEDDAAPKYDSGREEIVLCQRVIQNADKLEAITSKIECPDQTKTDIAQLVSWIQKDMSDIREWVHKNKKQNKAR